MNGEPSVSVLGRPASGKSTFLAALYYALKQNAAAGLKLAELPADLTYLNSIVEKWEQFKTVERTAVEVKATVTLKLMDQSGQPVTLNYPDLSGEEFDEQWKGRTCDKAVVDSVRVANGLLLFVGPRLTEPTTIRDVLGAEVPGELLDQGAHKVFAPLDVPDDVVLVDLLQVVIALGPRVPVRTAIVFSAWDLIEKTSAEYGTDSVLPANWCERKLPLLSQFLGSNSPSLDVRLFGVSAIGGDLTHDREALQALTTHSDRMFVVEEDGSKHHDIRAPLNWVIGRR